MGRANSSFPNFMFNNLLLKPHYMLNKLKFIIRVSITQQKLNVRLLLIQWAVLMGNFPNQV